MYSAEEARAIALRFCIEEPIEVADFVGKGNINLDSVLVTAGKDRRRYLMQRINHEVFLDPDRVMRGMIASIRAQRHSISNDLQRYEHWRPIQLVPTQDGSLFLNTDGLENVWRLMEFIEGTLTYKSLSSLPQAMQVPFAMQAGRGLAIYSDLTSSLQPHEAPASLPGYRNTEIYYAQFRAALQGNRDEDSIEHPHTATEEERTATRAHYVLSESLSDAQALERRNDPLLQDAIRCILDAEERALTLRRALDSRAIRETVIHGDTKLENFLFENHSNQAVSLVDLDTVMPLTWLVDWGDMMRSLVNVAGEKERDLTLVEVNLAIFEAVATGFLHSVSSVSDAEMDLMPIAIEILALETGMRFLADYLRGETYFKLIPGDPPDLNRQRALVQIKLYNELRLRESETHGIIQKARKNR